MKRNTRTRGGRSGIVTRSLVGAAALITVTLATLGGGHGRTASAAAATLDDLVAQASPSDVPNALPRANQFLYLKIQFGNGQAGEFWLSVDGTHDGRMVRPDLGVDEIPIPGCRNGRATVVKGDQLTDELEPCSPRRVYNPDLPVAADEFAKLIQRDSVGNAAVINFQGKRIQSILEFSYLTKPQRIALIEAAKQLPGLRVSPSPAGAAAPAETISWNEDSSGRKGSIVVDPTTLQYVGTADGDVIVSRGIVDSNAVRP